MSDNQPAREIITSEHNSVDQLELYDTMIFDWLQEFATGKKGILKGQKLPVVFATPDRAFAEIRKVLERADGRQHSEVGNLKNVPLPAASISRLASVFDPTRYSQVPLRLLELVKSCNQLPNPEDIFRDDFGDVRFRAEYPLPYQISYQVDVWARNRQTLNLIQQWFMIVPQNGKYFYRQIDFTPVHQQYTKKWIRTEIDSIADASELEPGDDRNRTLRLTLDLTTDAWLWRPVTTVKTGKALTLQVIEGCPDDDPEGPVLDTIDIDLLDQFR